MKKLILTILVGLLVMPCLVRAAATCTQTVTGVMDHYQRDITQQTLTFVCTGGNGSIAVTNVTPSWNLAKIAGWYLFSVETVPTDNPTNLYDLTLTDASGVDVAGGKLANRSSTDTQEVKYINWPVKPTGLTLNITNNSATSATITAILTFKK